MRPNAYQTEHNVLREVLRRFPLAEVQSSRGAGRFDQMMCGVVAAPPGAADPEDTDVLPAIAADPMVVFGCARPPTGERLLGSRGGGGGT